MARVNGLLNNFVNGEITPKMRGRTDLPTYAGATLRQENFNSSVFGELSFRLGTEFSAKGIRDRQYFQVLPFIYDSEDSYFLEFSAGTAVSSKMRVFNSDGSIVTIEDNAPILFVEKRSSTSIVYHIDASSSGNWTTGNPVHTYNMTQSGYEANLYDSTLPTAVNSSAQPGCNVEVVIRSYGSVSAEGPIDVSALGATLSSEYCIAQPFNESVLGSLQYTQKQDAMFIASKGANQIQLLQRTSAAPTFSIQNYAIYEEPAAETGSTQRFNTTDNYPRSITFYKGRLWIAGTNTDPRTLWASESGNFDRFSDSYDFEGDANNDLIDSSGLSLTLAGNNSEITHLLGTKDFLYVQTLGGGYSIQGSGENGVITPLGLPTQNQIHNIGSSVNLPLQLVDNDIVFVERSGRGVRLIDYNFNRDKYEPRNIGAQSDHLLYNSCTRMAYARGGSNKLYLAVAEANAVCVAWDSALQVNGWSRYVVGWGGNPTTNEATINNYNRDRVIDVAAVPSAEILGFGAQTRSEDSVLQVVLRNNEYYIESVSQEVFLPVRDDFYISSSTEEEVTKEHEGYLYERQIRDLNYLDCRNITVYETGFGFDLGSDPGTGIRLLTVFAGDPATPFVAGDVGRRILGKRDGDVTQRFGVGVITEYVSSTSVYVRIDEEFSLQDGASNPSYTSDAAYFEARSHTVIAPAEGLISVVVDGKYVGDYEVDETRAVEIDIPGSVYQWGYRYIGIAKSINLQDGGTVGPAETKLKNVCKVGVSFRDTGPTKIGTDIQGVEPVNFPGETVSLNRPNPLFNGERMVHFKETWDRNKNIYVLADQCAPCNVQALVPYMETSND